MTTECAAGEVRIGLQRLGQLHRAARRAGLAGIPGRQGPAHLCESVEYMRRVL